MSLVKIEEDEAIKRRLNEDQKAEREFKIRCTRGECWNADVSSR